MNPWPPNVLVASGKDIMRQLIRDILRNCGISEILHRPSCEAIFSATERCDTKWHILILDHAMPNALKTMKNIRRRMEPDLKVILVLSHPTKQEIVDAIQAGANDILTSPFTSEMIEKKLHRLTRTAQADPGERAERRRFPRIDAPVIIVAPSLSESPLVPEDISAAGCKVVVLKEPDRQITHELSIQVSEQVFEGCKAEVAWIRENEAQPGTWSVSLLIRMPDDQQAQFSAALEGVEFFR